MVRQRELPEMAGTNAMSYGTAPGDRSFLRDVHRYDTTDVTQYQRSYSLFFDSTTPPGSPRIPLACQHVKYRAAQSGFPSKHIVCPDPVPDLYLDYFDFPQMSRRLPTASSPDWAELAAKLVSQLNGAVQEGTLLGVSCMELSKTAAMFRNPFNLMRTDWRQAVKKLTPGELAKSSANLWLEHRYGWNALYHDIKSFAKTWNRIMTPSAVDALSYVYNRYSAKSSTSITPLSTHYADGINYWLYAMAMWPKTDLGFGYYWTSRVRYLDAFAISYATCHQLQAALSPLARCHRTLKAFGLTTSDVVSTIWEAMPYSFVVDWFIDLQALGYKANLDRLRQHDIRNLSYSTKIEQTYEVDLILSPYAATWGEGPWHGFTNFSSTDVPFGTLKGGRSTSYTRYPGLPDSVAFLDNCTTSSLSVLQSISATSLILQRLLK